MKKGSIQLPTSAMIWIILGVLMFSMTYAMFSNIFNTQNKDFEDLEELSQDVSYLDAGESKSKLFELDFYEGMLVFFENYEDVLLTTHPNHVGGIFRKQKEPQTYLLSPADVCEGYSCACVFRGMDYEADPRVPMERLCEPMPKTFLHPQTNDQSALVVVPAYNYGSQMPADAEASLLNEYNFATNASGGIFIIDRWTLFQPYRRGADGTLVTVGVLVAGAALTALTGGLGAPAIIVWVAAALGAAGTAAVANDQIYGGGNTNEENVLSDADFNFYEGGIIAQPLTNNRRETEQNMMNYAYLQKIAFYISVVDNEDGGHFLVCLFPEYCEAQVHALQREQDPNNVIGRGSASITETIS